MQTVASEFELIKVGTPTHFGGLTIFPLFRNCSTPAQPGYMLLEEAVMRGAARVTELGEGGSVPELHFENLGEDPVLLLDGEELVGAKQNRVLNLTILAPARQTITIPVSCVEAGRWHAESDAFQAPEKVMYSRARAAKAAQVSFDMAANDSRNSDQSAIWNEIAMKAVRLSAPSPTQAMDAIYGSRANTLDTYMGAFSWAEGQAGVAFGMGPGAMGLDLMDHPHTLRTMFPKLVRSYALDALEAPNSPAATPNQMADFLARVGKAECLVRPAVGIGEDVRITGDGISGAALWAGHHVHLCAFSVNGSDLSRKFSTRITRPTGRRPRRRPGQV